MSTLVFSKLTNKKGQTFIEFIFLLLVIMGLSFTLSFGVAKGIGARWKYLVEIISKPSDTNISY